MDCIKNNIETIKRQNNFICIYKMAYNNTCNSINTGYFPFFINFKKESKIIKYTYTKQHKHSNSVPVLLYNYYFLYKVIYNPTILFIPTNPNSDYALMYGGLASTITGGNFLEGAAIGLVVTALNHALHEALDPDPKKQNDKNKQTTNNQVKENNCQTCLDENTKNKNLLGSNYVGSENPKSNDKSDNYSLPPINEADANAKEHDLRYNKMNIKGLKGLLLETEAIGADYDFVYKQFKTALMPFGNNIQNSSTALISGSVLGFVALPKTIFQLSRQNGLINIYINYKFYK